MMLPDEPLRFGINLMGDIKRPLRQSRFQEGVRHPLIAARDVVNPGDGRPSLKQFPCGRIGCLRTGICSSLAVLSSLRPSMERFS